MQLELSGTDDGSANGKATVENRLMIPYTVRRTLNTWPSKFTPRYFPIRNENSVCSTTCTWLFTAALASQKLDMTQTSISNRMDEQMVIYRGPPDREEQERSVPTLRDMEESVNTTLSKSSQTWWGTSCMLSFIQSAKGATLEGSADLENTQVRCG